MKIQNDIKENICGFEVSKLLRENGFDHNVCYAYYNLNERYPEGHNLRYTSDYSIDRQTHDNILAPTQSMAVKWLRINFGVWIDVGYEAVFKVDALKAIMWYSKSSKITLSESEQYSSEFHDFPSPKEAYDMALLHVLKNIEYYKSVDNIYE